MVYLVNTVLSANQVFHKLMVNVMLSALKGSSAQMAIAISAVLNARCVKTMHHPVHSAIQEVIPCTVNQFSHHGATGV